MLVAEPLQITRLIAKVLERLGIRYCVGRSLASSLHGIPRATQDVDLVADLGPEHVTALVQALEGTFSIDADMVRDAIQHRSSFNVVHLDTMFKIDIFVVAEDAASQDQIARRQSYRVSDVPGDELFLSSAEDIVVQKLRRFQMGRTVSERQWDDALGVLRVQGSKLDLPYLQRAAERLGGRDILQQALQEAGLSATGSRG